MKKILTFISVLSIATLMATPIFACTSQPDLDKILTTIANGNDKYDLWNFDPLVQPPDPATTIPTILPSQTLLKTEQHDPFVKIANEILAKASISDPIKWYGSKTAEKTNCYNCTITNGTLDPDGSSKTWDILATTARITVNVNYEVGTVDQNHQFQAQQKVAKTLFLKCCYSNSDYMIQTVTTAIEAKNWNQTKPLKVTIDPTKIPNENTSYTDFATETQITMQETVIEALSTTKYAKTVNIIIKSDQKTSKNVDNTIKIDINFKLIFQDSTMEITNYSTLKFVGN